MKARTANKPIFFTTRFSSVAQILMTHNPQSKKTRRTINEASITGVKWTIKGFKIERLAHSRVTCTTHCVTKMNIMASKALLAEFLKIKLKPMPIVYTDVSEFSTFTLNTDSEIKNRITRAKNSSMWSSVWRAAPTSRILRLRKRRSR